MFGLLSVVCIAASLGSPQLAERRVLLELPPGFDSASAQALTTELAAGLDSLPQRLQHFPHGPLRIVLRRERSDFGMGSADPKRPEWSDDRSTFFLYAYEEPPDPRALSRLSRLTESERERLWRRRAIVHAVLQRWDDLLHWSALPEWSSITGWDGNSRGNDYLWAYSRARGMDSASLDLVTFAEEALVPAESLRDDAEDPDDRLECQEFSKLRFLHSRFATLDRSLRPPGAGELEARPLCPAFDAWADLAHLSHFELLLSAPSGLRPQSAFGHLMIRPVHGEGSATSFERVVEIAALTGFTDPAQAYFWRGLTGGYQNIFGTTPLSAIRAEHIDQDERTLRRFRLNLTANERARLMERLWELERRGYFPYRFFSDNCASFVAFAVNGALEGGRHIDAKRFFVLPTGVLDAAARVTAENVAGNPVPLLVPEPGALQSHRARALEAERKMAEVLAELRERAPSLAERWSAFADAAQSPDLQRRLVGYGSARELVTATLALRDARAASLASEMIALAVTQARYVVQSSEEQLRQLDRRRPIVPPGLRLPSAEELQVQREVRFQHELRGDRVLESVRDYVRLEEFLEALPRRPLTVAETAEVEAARRERKAWFELTSVQGDVFDAVAAARLHDSETGAEAGVDADADADTDGSAGGISATSELELHEDVPKLRFSGLARFALGVAAVGGAKDRIPTPALVLKSAFLRERLGERRELGLDSLNELRLVDSWTAWSTPNGPPQIVAGNLTMVSLLSTPREPSIARSSWLDRFGFWISAEYSRRADRPHPGLHRWHADAVLPLLASPSYERHLLLAFGAEGQAAADWLPVSLSLGPRAGLIARMELPIARAQALRLRAFYVAPVQLLGDQPGGFEHQLFADATLDCEVGEAGANWVLQLSARAEVTLAPRPYSSLLGMLALEWP